MLNKAPLTIDYFNIGQLECKSVRWERNSVSPSLLLDFLIQIQPYGNKKFGVTLFNIEGDVILGDEKVLGRVYPIEGPLLFPSIPNGVAEHTTILRIELDWEGVSFIESFRAKGISDLTLKLNVVAYIEKEFGKGSATIQVEIPEGVPKRERVYLDEGPYEKKIISKSDKSKDYSLKRRLAEITALAEKEQILKILNKTNWNRTKAAELLGISYRSLLYKIKEYRMKQGSGNTYNSLFPLGDSESSVSTKQELSRVVHKRILCVDDDPTLLSLLQESISELGDYEVFTSNDGEKALEIIKQLSGELDLVITDCNRPGLNGMEMSKIIKKEYPEIPIVMATGYYSKTVNLAPEGVLYTILSKPFRIEKLGEIIKAAILSKE